MNYLLTVAFANERVLSKSYEQLHRTMVTDPLPVLLWDNCYPLNWMGFGADLADKYGFTYRTTGENVGLYKAFNNLIAEVPKDCENVILYDGDNFPTSPDWHLTVLKVLEDPEVVHVTLMNDTIAREFKERPHDIEYINGVRCFVTKQAMTNTVCGFKMDFLRKTSGLIGGKYYYGGNEIAMWPYYEGKKWVYLADIWEDKPAMMALHDWQYQQYKSLYAHKGLDMSFTDYILSNPERIEDIKKYIWG